ncbi:hypothetical protein, partial [Coprococcus sp. AF51-11b1]
LGINVSSVYGYMWRTKKSRVEAVEYYYTKNAEESISVSSVRDKARKKGMSLQEAAKYYIERNSYD